MERTKRSDFRQLGPKVPTVWNPNVRISVNRGFGPNCLKSEHSDFRQLSEIRTTEIRTDLLGPERPKSEQGHTEQLFVRISALSEIRTFGFRTLTVQSTSENRTFGFQTVLKSERSIVRFNVVRISNVRARDKLFGIRTFGFQTVGSFWSQLFGTGLEPV